MIEGGGGAIINLSSINGLRAGWIADVHYSAAKGGVIAMTKNMAVHHGRDNIRVNAIAPGHIHGSIVATISEDRREMRRRAAPLGDGRHGMGCRLGGRCSWRATKRAGFPVLFCRLMPG